MHGHPGTWHSYRLGAALALLVGVIACGADDAGAEGDWFGSGGNEGDRAGGADTGNAGADASAGMDDASLPPEEEEALDLSLPTASERYVFVASRATNTVARIDSVTLAVTPIRVGREPTVVQTTPAGDVAVVLNQGADTVSIIHAGPDEDRVDTADIIPGCNALLMSPSGTHAVAWYDNGAAEAGDRIGSLQEVAVIDLETSDAWEVTVGFNIRGVQFDEAGERGFVVTESGVTVLPLRELDDDIALPELPLGDDPLVLVDDREVRVGPAGRYAVVRSAELAGLRVLDLEDGAAATVLLSDPPTDIDLIAGDTTAVAALRGSGQIALIDLDASVAGSLDAVRTIDVDGVTPGVLSLTDDERLALAYTTAFDERRVAAVELWTGRVSRVVSVAKTIRLVAASPTASRALVVHQAGVGEPVAGESIASVIERSEAISIIDLTTGYTKLMLLPVEPGRFAFSADGGSVFVMLGDAARDVRQVEWIDLQTFARRTIQLDAEPETIGVVRATGRVFVSQVSEQGRITFIDPADGSVQHITGFQLNTYIE